MRNAACTLTSIQLAPVVPLTTTPAKRRAQARYGELEVVAPLATGGMGGVYLAQHARTGERFAVKVLDAALAKYPEVVSRLHAEHAISLRASHPGLIRIHASHGGDQPYLVMEYVAGQTLTDVSAELTVGQIAAIGAQIAAALGALHDAGVAHCDVKPDNVLLTAGGRVKVVDFGVSRVVGDARDAARDASTIAGTPWCMAPEQWAGSPELASDVYALGCVLFDLLTGDAPFSGSLPELMFAHQEQRPARPSWLRAGVPAALDRLVLRALAKAPADRPSMHEVAVELAALADALADDVRVAS